MERKDEITELLKHLLGKANKAINDNHYSTDADKILNSSKELLEVSKLIEKYVNELNELTQSNN